MSYCTDDAQEADRHSLDMEELDTSFVWREYTREAGKSEVLVYLSQDRTQGGSRGRLS